MNKRSTQLLIRFAVIAVLAVGGYFLLRGLDFDRLGHAVAHAALWPLALGAVINFSNLYCKSVAWHVLLAPAYNVRPTRLFRYAITTAAISSLAPMRAGEVVRVWLLKSRDKVPVSETISVALAEKIFDIVAMLMLVAPLPWLLPALPKEATMAIVALCGGAAVGMVVWLVLSRKLGDNIPARFRGAVRVLKLPWPRLLSALLVLFVAWVVDLAVVLLVMHALGIDQPWAAGIFVLLVLNAAIALPSTPAQAGAFEVGAVTGLHFLHVPPEQSLAFAVLYHAIQIFPLMGVALCDSRFVLKAQRQMSQDGAVDHSAAKANAA